MTKWILCAALAFIAVDQWQDYKAAQEEAEYRAFLIEMRERAKADKQTARPYRPPVGIYWDEEDMHTNDDTLILDITRQQRLDDIENRLFMIELFND